MGFFANALDKFRGPSDWNYRDPNGKYPNLNNRPSNRPAAPIAAGVSPQSPNVPPNDSSLHFQRTPITTNIVQRPRYSFSAVLAAGAAGTIGGIIIQAIIARFTK